MTTDNYEPSRLRLVKSQNQMLVNSNAVFAKENRQLKAALEAQTKREQELSLENIQLGEALRAADKRIGELLTLIKEIRADLRMRGEDDSDGVRVLGIGRGILYSMDAELNKQGEEDAK